MSVFSFKNQLRNCKIYNIYITFFIKQQEAKIPIRNRFPHTPLKLISATISDFCFQVSVKRNDGFIWKGNKFW